MINHFNLLTRFTKHSNQNTTVDTMVSRQRMQHLDEKTKRKQCSFLDLGTVPEGSATWTAEPTVLCLNTKLNANLTANDDGLTITNDDAGGHDRRYQDQRRLIHR